GKRDQGLVTASNSVIPREASGSVHPAPKPATVSLAVIPREASGSAHPAPKPATTSRKQIPTLASLVRDDSEAASECGMTDGECALVRDDRWDEPSLSLSPDIRSPTPQARDAASRGRTPQ